jgi:8-oxo-dGTP diphosphatase
VLVGVIADSSRRVLISRRIAGKHLAGAWEFPGGKRERGERRLAALRRELSEELGIDVRSAIPFIELVHDYPDRRVKLDVWWIESYAGDPAPLEGQALRWVRAADLAGADLLPADRPIVEAVAARLS